MLAMICSTEETVSKKMKMRKMRRRRRREKKTIWRVVLY
jgi:hypothetical protein